MDDPIYESDKIGSTIDYFLQGLYCAKQAMAKMAQDGSELGVKFDKKKKAFQVIEDISHKDHIVLYFEGNYKSVESVIDNLKNNYEEWLEYQVFGDVD